LVLEEQKSKIHECCCLILAFFKAENLRPGTSDRA
jgi:hypothetical protein